MLNRVYMLVHTGCTLGELYSRPTVPTRKHATGVEQPQEAPSRRGDPVGSVGEGGTESRVVRSLMIGQSPSVCDDDRTES